MRITTREELIEVIRLAKDCEQQELTLFTAYKHLNNYHPCVMKLEGIHLGTPIHSDGAAGEFLYFKSEYGWHYESLKDRNIPENHYNQTWWFTTEEEAQDYIDPTTAMLKKIRNILANREISEGNLMSILADIGWNNKIKCIKAIRAVTGAGLKDSKDYLEYHDNRRGNNEYYRGEEYTLGDILAEALKRH